MTRDTRKSLELWKKHGKHVLMAMPYADSLIASAQGCELRDIDGNEILDLSAGQFCSILGNNHPRYIEKFLEQTQRVTHLGTQFLSPIVLEASAKLAEVAPGDLSVSLLLSTGTEANECAISLAKTYTGKTGVIGFNRGYYGLSLATKSLSSIFSAHTGRGSEPSVPESFRFLAPHCFHCPVKNHYPECNFVCIDNSIETAVPRRNDIAAILVEPVFSAGGIFVPPEGYFKRLKEFAQEIGALLIFDEAQTGFGRTGRWFACEHHDVQPDIMVMSKSTGAGFPVSAVITTEAIAERVAERRWLHLASHQSDPLAAAAVAATIDVVREEELVHKAESDGRYFMDCLRHLQTKYPVIFDVRGLGLMIGLELGASEEGSAHELCEVIVALCESRGVHLTYTYFEPVIRFLPALTISREQIDHAISVLDESISRAIRGDVMVESLLPKNPHSRELVQRLRGNNGIAGITRRLFETSPKQWVEKLKDKLQP